MIFVTGGTGILGSQLLFDLCQDDIQIRALYRSEPKRVQLQQFFQHFDPKNGMKRFEKIEWVQGDLLDIVSLEEFMIGCDVVYHCAALVSFHKRDFNKLIKINREGTTNIVNVGLTIGIKKLCYVSSTAAIGGSEKAIVTEKTSWKNTPTTTGYSISKYSAEKEVWRGIEEGLDAVIVNPCVILGAGNWNDSSLTLLRTLGKGTKYYPPGANATVDARDVSRIMIKLMKSDISGERYLCTGSNQSFKELMDEVTKQLKVKPPRKPVKRWMVSFARRVLGFVTFFTGKQPSITKETVNTLFSKREYNNKKVKSALKEEFYSLEEMVRFAIEGRLN
ncbi:MAG: NAD-dependent epimerase/dehydratase family protein [Crocinitomicaceae bacterium]|nr:NAD-dependent epimerase/dehydratase family protein [Flavobacteriales bacterium]NQZ35822.1 NAD-dependent epimerase/dehydratase family protein [Crocinitomicaceae bacterium]